MKKEVKKLLAYLLALAIVLTSVFTGQIVTKTTVKAATLENDGTEITAESEAPVEITTNAEGQTVYTLTGDVTNGLKITLAAGETVILDGKGIPSMVGMKLSMNLILLRPRLRLPGVVH